MEGQIIAAYGLLLALGVPVLCGVMAHAGVVPRVCRHPAVMPVIDGVAQRYRAVSRRIDSGMPAALNTVINLSIALGLLPLLWTPGMLLIPPPSADAYDTVSRLFWLLLCSMATNVLGVQLATARLHRRGYRLRVWRRTEKAFCASALLVAWSAFWPIIKDVPLY